MSQYIKYSPLDQFEILQILKLNFFGFLMPTKIIDFSITNLTLFNFIIISIIYFLYKFLRNINIEFFSMSRLEYYLTLLHKFVKNLIIENIGSVYLYLFMTIYFLFIFLVISNLIGMIPYAFTITSHVIITLTLSFSFFIFINIFGVKKNGINFFSLFLPSGAPLIIAPFLIVIELISYFARVLSLGIRLFANMMSGHTLLIILSGFVWFMLTSFFLVGSLFPMLVVFAVMCLEMSIGFLQAYVFTILVSIYFNDVIHLH